MEIVGVCLTDRDWVLTELRGGKNICRGCFRYPHIPEFLMIPMNKPMQTLW